MMTTTSELMLADQCPTVAGCGSAASMFESQTEALRKAKIMIVDDESINLTVARRYLSLEGFQNFVLCTDSREAVAVVKRERPDLLLLDIMMPHVSGLDVLAALRSDPDFANLPVVVLTASNDQQIKRRALELAANDFLAKPVDPTELVPRLRNVLMAKLHRDNVEKYAHELEAEVLSRTAELARSRQEVIHCLARAAEFRDDTTGRHVFRVGRYARLIAAEMGWSGERLNMLEQAAQLHDIGKIGIPDSILLKPGKLEPEEIELMRRHSGFGKRIMQSLPEHEANTLRNHTELGSRLLQDTDSPILAMASTISLSHHEKWDGSGYPLCLAGEDIPIEGRITAVADVFDALSSKRPYKEPMPVSECFKILEDGRGKHFDPLVLDAFFRCRPAIVRTQLEYADVD